MSARKDTPMDRDTLTNMLDAAHDPEVIAGIKEMVAELNQNPDFVSRMVRRLDAVLAGNPTRYDH